MKKTLFSLEEIMPSNIYKNTRESNIYKNKERNRKNFKSVVKLKKDKIFKQANSQQKIKSNDLTKTPLKFVGKMKINKIINNINECNKNNINTLSLSTNGKQILLLDYFLHNNHKGVNKSIYLIGSNKEEIKNLNKVTKSLFPLKKQINNPKFQNNRYINKNSNDFKIINRPKDKTDIKKNENKINSKKWRTNKFINNKDEEIKNNTIFINKTNTISKKDNNSKSSNFFKIKDKVEKDSKLLKTSINLSNKKKDFEKSGNESIKKQMKEVKTPNNIFKNKLINILSSCINNNDNNKLNKSDNALFINQIPNRRYSSNKNTLKSNSLEKFLNQKVKINNLSTKSLFSLTKMKKRNPSDNSYLKQKKT